MILIKRSINNAQSFLITIEQRLTIDMRLVNFVQNFKRTLN